VPELEVDTIIAKAIAIGDVPAPDEILFRSNLELLVDSINAEAGLRPEVLNRVQYSLALPLRNQIEVSHWVSQYPEIRDEPIEKPIFLTGLPRSGTTYFQYLFDSNPAMRLYRYWEGQRACPPSGFDPASVATRIQHCAEEKARMANNELSEKIAQIHLSDIEGPEECLNLLEQTFFNVGYLWPYRVPTYFDRVLETADIRACYHHHKLVLQLLQWRGERRRWTLKWPCHMVALPEILDVYPDASFIVTHRDPVQALASNCSLTAMLRRSTSREVDLHEVGQQMKTMIHRYLERFVDFDKRHGDKIAHVDYATAVERPEVAVAQAFETLNIEITPGVTESIMAWRASNPPGKRGKHSYNLTDYGLDADEVQAEYAFYIDRYNIPSERGVAA
jgi:hypothetical protein